jgi:hypothetical protein
MSDFRSVFSAQLIVVMVVRVVAEMIVMIRMIVMVRVLVRMKVSGLVL